MEEVLINMGCIKTVRDIISKVDSGTYNIVDEYDRKVLVIVEKNKSLETRTWEDEGWILSIHYDENGEITSERYINFKNIKSISIYLIEKAFLFSTLISK